MLSLDPFVEIDLKTGELIYTEEIPITVSSFRDKKKSPSNKYLSTDTPTNKTENKIENKPTSKPANSPSNKPPESPRHKSANTPKPISPKGATITKKDGNILSSTDKYILYQADCTSTVPDKFLNSLFNKYKYADIYTCRKKSDIPGTVITIGSKTLVCALLCAIYPDNISSESKNTPDNQFLRIVWFRECLDKLKDVKGNISIALFGNKTYIEIVEKWAKDLSCDVIISIY